MSAVKFFSSKSTQQKQEKNVLHQTQNGKRMRVLSKQQSGHQYKISAVS